MIKNNIFLYLFVFAVLIVVFQVVNSKKILDKYELKYFLNLLDNYGDKTFDYIRGMYSFVSYNKKKNSLLVAIFLLGLNRCIILKIKIYLFLVQK